MPGTHGRGKNSTKIPTQLLPWLLSISYSVKVIKVSVWVKKKSEVCRLGPFCCSLLPLRR